MNLTGIGTHVVRMTVMALLVCTVATARAEMKPQFKYAADALSYTNNQAVTNWTDSSGYSRDATQTNNTFQPFFQTNVVNGKPAVRFTAAKNTSLNYLNVPDANLAQPFTLVVVGRALGNHASLATDVFYDGPASGGAYRTMMALSYSGTSENEFFILKYNTHLDTGFGRSVWTNYHVWEACFNGSSSVLYCDGSNAISGTLDTGNLRALLMGSPYSGVNNGLNGDIAEMHCYSGAPTATERNAMGAYLASKYGLTSTYSSSSNLPPYVSLIAPTNGTTISTGDVSLVASAYDLDGSVTNVAFYANDVLIAATNALPYSYTWNPMPGAYALTVRAWDNSNAVSTSTAANIDVRLSTFLTNSGSGGDALVASAYYADTKFGASTVMEVSSSDYKGHSLVKFDLGAFPNKVASIDHIILRLTASFVIRANPPYVIEAYRVTNSWVEADVTWNQRASGAAWSNGGGGDYDGALLGSFDWSALAISTTLDSTTEKFSMELLPGWTNAAARMALIAAWKSDGNQGLLLKQQTESGLIGYLGIRTREQATSSYWPELTVFYAPAPKGTVVMFR